MMVFVEQQLALPGLLKNMVHLQLCQAMTYFFLKANKDPTSEEYS